MSCCEKKEESWEFTDLVTSHGDNPTKIIVFYVNVGQLSTENAEKHVIKMKKVYDKAWENCAESFNVIYIPVRTRETQIETFEV